ncbi:MAG: phage holin family protein [Euzebyales bacterium]|jgi:putative membrane protein|nr:phage holin family protein [Euzebyales bacterium]
MRSFLLRTAFTGVAIWIAALLVPGVELADAELSDQVVTILLVALIFGVVNALLGPVVKLLALPVVLLTLGLFSLVINALLLWVTSWLAGQLGLAFSVEGFWAALLGALVVSLVTVGLGAALKD